MSMTITLSVDDEEHILIVDPGDNVLNILRNVLGITDNCNFIVNGKQISTINDLSKELRDKTTIEVTRYNGSTHKPHGAPVALGPQGFPWELKSHKNPSRPTIKIETVHISCSSDSYDVNENMAGLIIYSFDNKQIFELNGHRCRTGYILMKATKNIEQANSNQGIVHGNLFKWFFGIEPDNRFVGAGFALHERKFKFNSGVFNARNDDYHDTSSSMSQNEIGLIKYAMNALYINHAWKLNSTMSISNIDRSRYVPGGLLPIQNHPKSTANKFAS